MRSAEGYGVLRPRSLSEALRMLRDEGPLVPLAGGTDLFVTLNASGQPQARFLDLWRLDELRGIRRRGKTLELGALTTYTDCLRSKKVLKELPILAAAAAEVGGPQIQNRGTIGGNIGNGSPAGDSLPVLAAAEARVVLASAGGEREIALTELYTGYRQTQRRPDELIVAVRMEVPRGKQRFHKVGPRAAQAISKVVMASIGHRIAFGSMGPTVLRARRVEAYLAAGGRGLAEAQRILGEELRPIDDIRSTAVYRRRVAQNLLGTLLSGR